jgi:chemotaxis protein CheD
MPALREATARRFYDDRFEGFVTAVAPGDHAVTGASDEMLSTLLGSCVSACIADPDRGIGGMNHFLLPKSPKAVADDQDIQSLAYGDNAMEVLINGLLKAGARRGTLRAKIFGGASMHPTMESFDVGRRNIRFVEEFLEREQIPILARDVGGEAARRIVFHPASGRVHVNQLAPAQFSGVASREAQYARNAAAPRKAALELF